MIAFIRVNDKSEPGEIASDNMNGQPTDHLTGHKDTRETLSVFIGLGSNLGDREANLREARARIEKIGLDIIRASSVYETEPVGYKNQEWFLNQVIECRIKPGADTSRDKVISEVDSDTDFRISALGLLNRLLGIEDEMGRRRLIPGGPRVVDIDLLLYGDKQVEIIRGTAPIGLRNAADRAASLIIPHPRMHSRRFVLEPLCEIAPRFLHPTSGKTCCELLAALDDPSIVRLYGSGG